MKTKFSKRILSLFLAVMMVVTSIPMFAMTAFAGTTLSVADQNLINNNEYLMTYFKDDTTDGQQVYMAVPNDGANWTPLNSNSPVLRAPTDKGAGAARDPYLYRGPDGTYYIIATSMDAKNGWWAYTGRGIYIWSSPDLVNWSEATFVNNFGGLDENNFGRIWAPQIIWDNEVGKYMIYVALCTGETINGTNTGNNNDMFRFYCTDPMDPSTYDWSEGSFENMFETNVKSAEISRFGSDVNHQRIDGDIFYDVVSQKYIMYYSDYGDGGTDGIDFTLKTYYAVSDKIGGPYVGTIDPEYCIYNDSKMEGFTTYTLNNGTVMAFGDLNTGTNESRLFTMGGSASSITAVSSNINNIDGAGNRARHGSAISLNPAINTTYSAANLKSLIDECRGKLNTVLSGSTVYKNMQGAYDACVSAQKAYDTYYYGGDTTVNLDLYCYRLRKAIDEMTAWTQYTGTAKARFSADTSDITQSQNLLYSKTGDSYALSNCTALLCNETILTNNGTAWSKLSACVYCAPTVVLYDGKTSATIPVISYVDNFIDGSSGHAGNRKYGLYLTNSSYYDLQNAAWKGGENSGLNFATIYGKADTNLSITASSSNYVEYKSGAITAADDQHNYQYFANVIKLNDNLSNAFSSNSYSVKLPAVNWNLEVTASVDSNWFSFKENWGSKLTYSKEHDNNVSPIYAVNYASLVTAISDAFAELPSSVNNYTQGRNNGLSTLLGNIDKATSYDPNSAFVTVNSVSDNVTSCGENIKDRVNSLSQPKSLIGDTDDPNYQVLRTAMDNYKAASGNYTETSINQYNSIYDASKTLMADVLENGYVHGSWVGADATALNSKDSILNPKLDKTALNNAIDAKDNPVIFDENGNQTKTYASWVNVSTKLNTAKSYQSYDGQYSLKNGGTYYDISNSYGYQVKDTYIKDAVDTATTELNGANLVDVDTVGYPSFDAAKTVVDSIDRAKYTTSALEAFDRAVSNAKDLVYYTPTADEISAYNDNTEGTDITGDLKISTSLTNTDAATIALLNAVNTLNTVNEDGTQPNVNKYSAVIYSGDITDTSTPVKTIPDVYYGETFEYSISEPVPEDSIVTWVVTVYANDADLNAALAGTGTPTPVNSQVISTYNGTTIERTANGSMCIQYFIEEGSKTDSTTYKVYNAYGNVIAVEYKTEALDKDYFKANYADPVLPFYTFKEWSVSAADNGVVKVKPVFVEIPTKTVTVDTNYATISFNKMSGGNAVVGATATITGNSENIYGWAVATGGKYQIVGYGKDYKFNVFADESYVPIIKTESGYQINGTDLTANMVAGFSNNSNGNLSDNDYLAAKLAAKAPFVYVQDKLVKYKDGETNKVKFYIRVTAGTEADNLAYGIVVDGKKIASTAKNEGGQFYMATTKEKYDDIASINAYTSYTFQYTFTDSNDVTTVATIATADYAEVK